MLFAKAYFIAYGSERVKVNAVLIQIKQCNYIYCLIRNFAILPSVLQCPMYLLADREGPDQTMQMRKLILASVVCIRLRLDVFAWRGSYSGVAKTELFLHTLRTNLGKTSLKLFAKWGLLLKELLKGVADTACYLFILWLLYCICLSFPLVLGTWYGFDCISS